MDLPGVPVCGAYSAMSTIMHSQQVQESCFSSMYTSCTACVTTTPVTKGNRSLFSRFPLQYLVKMNSGFYCRECSSCRVRAPGVVIDHAT
jgi:hypothetical protein